MTDEQRPLPDNLDALPHFNEPGSGLFRASKEQDGKFWVLMESANDMNKPFDDGEFFHWHEDKDGYDFLNRKS